MYEGKKEFPSVESMKVKLMKNNVDASVTGFRSFPDDCQLADRYIGLIYEKYCLVEFKILTVLRN